ncbi:MAG: replicative DNA helicase [Planctomycetota bacterium]
MDEGSFDNGGGRPRSKQGKRKERPLSERVDKMFDRVPPHSLDAEQSLLGSLLLDPKAFGDVLTLVWEGSQFFSQAHAAIFDAMRDLYDRTEGVDIVQLSETLETGDVMELAGGKDYLIELAEAVPTSAGAVRYARIVSNKARLRRLIDAAGDILYEAFHAQSVTDDETDNVIDGAEQRIFEIASERESTGPETIKALIKKEFERLDLLAEGGVPEGVRTGFDDLDELTAGLQPGEMLIMAARPSMGKTALALNLAEQIALGGKTPWSPRDAGGEAQPVGVFSLEMSREALAQRLLSARSGVPSEKLRSGDVSMSEWEKLNDAAGILYETPIYIDDTPGLTILQLRARARRMMDRYELKAIIIDYLQLLTAPLAARESRQVEVSTISRQIKALARELRIPVVCLAQLNRGTEQRERNRPRMSDLRESGSIEQDADVVMLLHREAYYHRGDPEWDPKSPEFNPDNEDKLNLAELIIAKQRNGPTGTVNMVWDNSTTRFKNRDPFQAPGAGGGGHASGGYAGGGFGPSSAPPSGGGFGAPAPSRPAQGAAAQQPWQANADDLPDISTRGGLEPGTAGGGAGSGMAGRGGFFGPGRATGPAEDHRDGGGPDREDESFDDEVPF